METPVIYFVKYPEPGRVKTRLAETFGPEGAVTLYKSFVRDGLHILDELSVPVVVCFDPADREEDMRSWLGKDRKYLAQRGDDLGERMKNSFEDLFAAGAERALLMGSDVPDITVKDMAQALDALTRYGTSVIGPVSDGGYWLIGFDKEGFLPQAFEDMEWGGPEVFSKTLDRFGESGTIPVFLPGKDDVDTPDDLEGLLRRTRGTDFEGSATFRTVRRLLGE